MGKFRRFLCIFGSIIMISLLSCLFAACDTENSDQRAGDFYYSLRKDNTITVYVEKYDMKELVIPESINGFRVSAIGAPKNTEVNSTLSSIVFPETIQTIEKSAFINCIGLTEVNFPKGLVYINERAFKGCSSIKELHLPEGISEIGEEAFMNCSALVYAYLPNSVSAIGSSAFEGCPSLEIYAARESAPGWFSSWAIDWSGSAKVFYGAQPSSGEEE